MGVSECAHAHLWGYAAGMQDICVTVQHVTFKVEVMITLGQNWGLLYVDGLLLKVRWCLNHVHTVHFRYLLVIFKCRASTQTSKHIMISLLLGMHIHLCSGLHTLICNTYVLCVLYVLYVRMYCMYCMYCTYVLYLRIYVLYVLYVRTVCTVCMSES